MLQHALVVVIIENLLMENVFVIMDLLKLMAIVHRLIVPCCLPELFNIAIIEIVLIVFGQKENNVMMEIQLIGMVVQTV